MYLTELTKQNLAICYIKKKYIQNTMGEILKEKGWGKIYQENANSKESWQMYKYQMKWASRQK